MPRSINTIGIISVMMTILWSCESAKDQYRRLAETYFYPTTDGPMIYIYQDSLDPIYEMFERIVPVYDPLGKHLLVERYNSNFVLLESFDLLADKDYQVFNHVLYTQDQQIIANITDSTYMPWNGSGKFSSSFPSTVDSIMFTLANERSLNNDSGKFPWKGQELTTRSFTDSITTTAIDLKNKREKVLKTVAIHEFAEGIGRVRIKTADGKSNLVLKSIITERDWNTLRTK